MVFDCQNNLMMVLDLVFHKLGNSTVTLIVNGGVKSDQRAAQK